MWFKYKIKMNEALWILLGVWSKICQSMHTLIVFGTICNH